MYRYNIKDWILKSGMILSTELEYNDAKEMYGVFVLTCHKKGVCVSAEDFVKFLMTQGIKAELIFISKGELCSEELEDELAEEIQNLE